MTKIESETFPTLASLRVSHKELLQQRRNDGTSSEEFQAQVKQFIIQGQNTGKLLNTEDERWEAQNLLDYWANELYHLTQEDISATLEEFDLSQLPELDDSLCPYIGLDPFDTAAHNLFFGRDPIVKSMVNRLEEGRFLAVSGPSGSGKTSLVLAGLIPKLQEGALEGSQSWLYLPKMMPGSDPIAGLIDLLRSPDNTDSWVTETTEQLMGEPETLTNLINRRAPNKTAVLIIDQFEEIFTLCQDQLKQQTFMQNLLHLLQAEDTDHKLILTMRTDLESNLVRMAEFQTVYSKAQLRVTTMNAGELRQAIKQPADLVGLKLEDGLTEQLVTDVLGEPAALPLLQFTLLKLWNRRDKNRVTWEAYRELGGGRDALANSADKLYNNLNPAEQRTARRILLKMVRPTQGLDVVRNRVLRQQLYEPTLAQARVDYVVKHFVRERLVRLTPGDEPADDQLEIAHEALVKNWPRLIGWLEEERVSLRHRLRLTEMAEQWDALDRDNSALLRGVVLEEAQQYIDLSNLEKSFVEASAAAMKQAAREKEEAQRRELEQTRRFARRLSLMVVALAFVFVLALGFAILARQNAVEASENAQIAENNAATAEANEDIAQTNAAIARENEGIAQDNFSTAEAAKVEAEQNAQLAATAEAEALAQREIAETEREAAEAAANEAESARATAVANEALAEANARLAAARELASASLTQLGSDPQLSLLLALEAINLTISANDRPPAEAVDALYQAVRASQQIFTLAGHTGAVNDTAVSPDARWIATVSEDNSVKIWNAATGQEVHTLVASTSPFPVTSLAFSPDSTHLVTGNSDSLLVIWDVAAGTLVRALRGEDDGPVRAVAFHPDGERVVAGYEAGTARVWNYVSSSPLIRQFEHTGPVNDVLFTMDGSQFASAGQDGIIVFQNTDSGVPVLSFDAELNDAGSPVAINDITFNRDGSQLAAAKADGEVWVWEGNTFLSALPVHSGQVTDVAFSPDGDRLASTSLDGSAKVWDFDAERTVLTLSGHNGGVLAVDFYPDGERLVTAGTDSTARTWNANSVLEPLTLTDHRAGINSIRFNADGTAVTTASNDQTARIWDAVTGKSETVFSGHNLPVTAAAFHPTKDILATASEDTNVRLWDLTTNEVLLPFYFHPAVVTDLAFSNDGTLLATAAEDGVVRVWDTETNEEIAQFVHDQPLQTVAFDKNGDRVVATSGETAVVWQLESGQSLPPISGHNGLIQHAIFDPDANRLATAGADGLVKLWDLETGELIRTYSGHTGPVLWIAFNNDGSLLATASVDKTARLWDVAGGQVIRSILGHTSAVTAVAFHPEDTALATSSLDSTGRLSPLTQTNDLLAQAWERLSRPLSPAECTQYLRELPCLTETIEGDPPVFNP